MTNLFLYNENKEKYKKWMNKHQFYDESKPSVEFVKNGIILPPITSIKTVIAVYEGGGVIREDFSFVENSAYTRGREEFWENPITKGYIPKEYEYSDEEVMYAGAAFEHWGHFLTEITNRLYWFIENRKKHPNIKLAFIQYINPDFDFKNTYQEFLEMLGITKNDYIFITKPTKFKMVIVPEYSAMLGTKYKKEFIKIFDEIIKKVKPAKYKKIYLSREKVSSEHNIIGEKTFEKIFKKNGFKIVYPEKLSLKEQVSLIQGADYIASIYGSACHNLLFANKNVKVIIINRSSEVNRAQLLIDDIRKYNVNYVDCFYNIMPVTLGCGPFLVIPNKNLENCLFKYGFKYKAKDEINLPDKFILKYIKLYTKINSNKCLIENLKTFEPNGNIINSFIRTLTLLGYNNNKNKISKFKYYKYKILSKILPGKRGRRYKEKYKNQLLAQKIDSYIQSNNNYYAENSVLIITHDLTYSGAPLILIPAIEYYQKLGKKITVISMKDGLLKDWYKKNNIDIFIFDDIFSQQQTFLNLADNYNIIICNTVVTYPFVDLLNAKNKKVIWWLHEGTSVETGFIPAYQQRNNIHSLEYVLRQSNEFYVVSPYSKNLLNKYNSNITIFNYGIKDFYSEENKFPNNGELNISCVGSVCYRKGQDLLCEAVIKLPEKYRNKIVLNIIGENDNEFAKELINKYKTEENINFKGQIYFENKNEIYKDTDVLFCVSRDDPMPLVVTEAMILKIPVLVTSNAGQYNYIEDYINGFKIFSENINQLQEKIIWIINNKEKLKEIGEQGRQIYLKHFTIEKFEKELGEISTA